MLKLPDIYILKNNILKILLIILSPLFVVSIIFLSLCYFIFFSEIYFNLYHLLYKFLIKYNVELSLNISNYYVISPPMLIFGFAEIYFIFFLYSKFRQRFGKIALYFSTLGIAAILASFAIVIFSIVDYPSF